MSKLYIHKYELNGPTVHLPIPQSAEILSVVAYDEKIYLYVKYNPNDAIVSGRVFRTFMTGDELPENANNHYFIGTVVLYAQENTFRCISHVFEEVQ